MKPFSEGDWIRRDLLVWLVEKNQKKYCIPNGGENMVMNPMGSQSVKNHLKKSENIRSKNIRPSS